MSITIIAAVAENRAIGFNNRLLYWLPNDLRRFKQLTMGHTILMGRKTFESLPNGALPHRRNIVVSRSTRQLPGCECFRTISEALAHCEEDEEVFVIGGASIYKQTIDIAQRLCLTEIHDTPAEADTFFPPYDDWQESTRECHAADERHQYAYDFVNYVKS